MTTTQHIQANLHITFSLTILSIYAYCFYLLSVFDWEHSETKLLCFSIFFLIVFFLHRRRIIHPTTQVYWTKSLVLAGLLIFIIFRAVTLYLPALISPVKSDTGYHVQNAATMLFYSRENPYQSQTIAIFEDDPKFWGFKYGPTMMAGYLTTLAYPKHGFKLTNVAYLFVTAYLLVQLTYRQVKPIIPNNSTVLFALIALLIPQVLWYELFDRGVSDIFPAVLLLGALLAVKNKRWWWTGLLTGLSFSAKFFPAMLLILLFIRKRPLVPFYNGLLWGFMPLLPFLIWDPTSLINNSFIFHGLKQYDSTSLYTLVPSTVHFIFPVIQLSAIFFTIAYNFKQPIKLKLLTTHFVLLFLIFEVTHKEIHNNHLVALIPFLALVLAWYHNRVPAIFSSRSERPPAMNVSYRK